MCCQWLTKPVLKLRVVEIGSGNFSALLYIQRLYMIVCIKISTMKGKALASLSCFKKYINVSLRLIISFNFGGRLIHCSASKRISFWIESDLKFYTLCHLIIVVCSIYKIKEKEVIWKAPSN